MYVGFCALIASYSQFNWMLHQGLDIYTTWELFDHDYRYGDNAINRATVGINLIPVPFLEITLENRWFYNAATFSKPETLIIIHSWM